MGAAGAPEAPAPKNASAKGQDPGNFLHMAVTKLPRRC